MIDIKSINKILVIRHRFIGDMVLAIPFIKNLKEKFPLASIDILVSPNSGELLEGNPDVNNLIYFYNTKFHKYEKDEEKREKEIYHSFFACAKAIKEKKYDMVFVLKRSFSSALIAAISGARYRIGFGTEFRSFLLTHSIKYDKNIHEEENFLNCLSFLDLKTSRYIPVIYPTESERVRANGFLVRLDRFKPKVLIHATSAHPYKIWPKRYFAEVIDSLFEKFEAQFVFTGAKIDKETYDEILSWCKNKNKIKIQNLCGLISLRECFPLYQGLDLALCVDSGNAHIAAATGIPTYVLYGPTNSDRWLPIGEKVFPVKLKQQLPCQPCDVKVECSHLSCMKLLTPEIVLEQINNQSAYTAAVG